MMFKKCLAITLLAASLQAWGQTPASTASIERLLELTQVQRLMDESLSRMDQMAQGMAQQLGIEPADQPAFDRYMQQVGVVLREEMKWEQIKAPVIQIYKRHFSEEEVQASIAFYETPAGRSMIEKMPAVMREMLPVSQQMVARALPRIRALAEQLQADIQAGRKARADTKSE